MTRANRAVLGLLLALAAFWFGRAAFASRDLLLIIDALLALAGLACAATGARATRYPVFLLSLLVSGEWLTSVWLSFRIGYFAHQSLEAEGLALLPGLLIELSLVYACVASVAFFGRATRRID